MSRTDTRHHFIGTVPHGELVGIKGLVKVARLLVHLANREAHIGIIWMGFRRLDILAHDRFIILLSFASQLPTNTSQYFQRCGTSGAYSRNHRNMPAHERSDIAYFVIAWSILPWRM